MSLDEAYHLLCEQLRYDGNITCIGQKTNEIVIYTKRLTRPGEYPEEFHGFKVTTCHMGRISPLGGAR